MWLIWPLNALWPDSKKDIAIKTSNHALLYMSANIKPPPQTKEQSTTAGQHGLPINTEDMTAVSRAGRMTSRPTWMSLFIASFIRLQATSVTSCQTSFYSQLVDFSGAINSVDLWRPWFRSPRWLWRKATDVSRRNAKPSLVDIKGSSGLLQKNHCVWVDFLYCRGWLNVLPVWGPLGIPWEMMTH